MMHEEGVLGKAQVNPSISGFEELKANPGDWAGGAWGGRGQREEALAYPFFDLSDMASFDLNHFLSSLIFSPIYRVQDF